MKELSPESQEPKARRSRGARSPRTAIDRKVKISAYISVDSARRLGIHATMTDQDRSQIIDALIRDNLRDWVVQYRPSGAKTTDDGAPEPEAQAG